jgi:hypothetical protein
MLLRLSPTLAVFFLPLIYSGGLYSQASEADVSSIDGIIAALYDTISGDAGEARDWDRWYDLFVPGAVLSSVVPGTPGFERATTDPQTFAVNSGPILVRDGFHETEIHRVTEQFAQIAHVFSTYETRLNAVDPEPLQRGINSFQLMHDGSRWWVVSIYWQLESAENPIPARYGG